MDTVTEKLETIVEEKVAPEVEKLVEEVAKVVETLPPEAVKVVAVVDGALAGVGCSCGLLGWTISVKKGAPLRSTQTVLSSTPPKQ